MPINNNPPYFFIETGSVCTGDFLWFLFLFIMYCDAYIFYPPYEDHPGLYIETSYYAGCALFVLLMITWQVLAGNEWI
jgi:hypothetical protein